MDHLKSHIRDIPDFPKKGILFRDITPILKDPKVFDEVIGALRDRYAGMKIDKIFAVESRGFIFAAPLAREIGAGLIPLRKPGKLPYETMSVSYALEYGEERIEVHRDAIEKGERVLVLDDLLATGGTAAAAVELARKLGGEVVEAGFVIELASLGGREKLPDVPVYSVVSYD
ncbi:MAG: adenine phosphoribosyltransferase [Candidatus Latescibacteria bacterium]|nr:adenine phosphoribosyltransferase [Candidatus Latescibacterota bacterium]NIM21310.1 adenine phosphoribosyltransferase [Candidatus Latescibacterota bacterium]NIM65491.1 adenine phosphoribosyltransferase [Candidatus Latescibacterota bacterium]NIO01871.1 adenine phosphoribosyltransferase [Candidatus Latescibacterota bacterium]NIO28684.1 adenine phosphoribosyltransferase [Candidatus Latescibacterota bacterium]